MTRTEQVPCICPKCEERIWVTMTITHDRGCWRTPNGDGWPESWEYEVKEEQCPECQSVIDEAWEAALDTAFQIATEAP